MQSEMMLLEGSRQTQRGPCSVREAGFTKTTVEPFLLHMGSENEKQFYQGHGRGEGRPEEQYRGVLCAYMEMS